MNRLLRSYLLMGVASFTLSITSSAPAAAMTQAELDTLIAKAERNDAPSEMKLIDLYSAGVEGLLAPDRDRALVLMERAAQQGIPEAMCMFGIAHLSGVASNADYNQGLIWLKKAAALDNPRALRILAMVTASGKGVPKNPAAALQYLTRAAELGDAEAENDLGEAYRRGDLGVEIDYETALKWFRASASAGFHEGLKNVGKCYHIGQGVKKDLDKALEYYAQAAAKGNLHAIYNTGMIYSDRKDYRTAVLWLTRASDKGHVTAMGELGELYRDGRGVVKNPEKAFSLFQKAVDSGDENALIDLAKAYENGDGVAPNPAMAFKYMSRAANSGDDIGQKRLGDYYCDGIGVAQNYAEAMRWYKKSAAQGYARAKTMVGRMYAEGNGVGVDYKTAAQWYESACTPDPESLRANPSSSNLRRTDREAFSRLGNLYSTGKGVTLDQARAITLYKTAAEQGDTMGCAYLGYAFMVGNGVPKDLAQAETYLLQGAKGNELYCQTTLACLYYEKNNLVEARHWCEKAALQNDAESQYRLASMIRDGQGGPVDTRAALLWFDKAAAQGNGQAKQEAEALRKVADSGLKKIPPSSSD